MKNTTQQPLKWELTGRNDNSGEFHSVKQGLTYMLAIAMFNFVV